MTALAQRAAERGVLPGEDLAEFAALLRVPCATLWTRDPEHGVLRCRAAHPRTLESPTSVPIEAANAHPALVAWSAAGERSPFAVGPGASLDVSIRRDGQVAAVLHFQDTDAERIWEEADRVSAFALAQLTAACLERVDRLRTEHALRERERQVEETQAIAGVGSWQWDTHDNRITWSAEQLRLHGLDEAGRPRTFQDFLALVHTEDRTRVQQACDDLLRTGEPFSFQYRIVRPDGVVRWLAARGRMATDPDSAHPRMVGTSQDVTERRDADTALRESEESYRTIFELASDAIFVHDPVTGAILDANRKACELHGSSLDDLRREGVTAVSQEQTPFSTNNALDRLRAAAAGSAQRFEWASRTRSGETVWTEVSLERVSILGQPRVLAIVRNATERKAAEEALQRAYVKAEQRVVERTAQLAAANRALEKEIDEHRVAREQLHRRTVELEALFRALPDTYFRVAADGTVLDHRAGADAGAYPRPEALPPALIGSNAHDVLPADSAARLRAGLDEVDRTGRLVCIEFSLPAGDSVREYETRIMPIGDGTHILVVRDMTERKLAEHALEDAKEAAERANRAKSEFLSRMSHELRTPMNSILGFAQVLARAELPANHSRSVQHILRGGRHLLQLINEVLEIARIEADRHILSLEPVRVGAVVQEAIVMVRPLAEQFGIRIADDECGGHDYFVHADRQRLVQVLINLIANAIKYNRPGGSVRLYCAVQHSGPLEQVVLRIEDTGRGIPADRQDALFTPFARLGAEQSEVEGTGLGLALSLRLTEAMGGTLSLERSSAEGSVFRLALNRTSSPLAQVEDTGRGEGLLESAPHGPATLLYIEDNLANLALIETVLEARPRWRTIPALQGQVGLELAREHAPDLILLDLHLPDLSGEEVLRRLRTDARTAAIPVVVISADATPSNAERLIGRGAAAFLTKPLDVAEFMDTLEQLLPDRAIGR